MQKTVSICENKVFRFLYNKGKSAVTAQFVIYFRANRNNKNRLGITVSKKIGNAVSRNRAKRILKEAYRLIENEIVSGFDIVLVARSGTPYASMNLIKKDLYNTFKKSGLIK